MKKSVLILVIFLGAIANVLAGGLLTNTNQSVAFVRNPSRDAAINIDAVYYNPAGVAFLEKGFYLSLNYQAAIQKREISSTFQLYQLNTNSPTNSREFNAENNVPAIPSIQFAYVINNKWSIASQLSIIGGNGKCEYENGISLFEGSIAEIAKSNYTAQQAYSENKVIYGFQIGATYKIIDQISVSLGLRGVYANLKYTGYITDITVNGKNSEQLFEDAKLLPENSVYDEERKQLFTQSSLISDYTLDCHQTGFGITPILGVNFKMKKWNLAAKYEFRTKLNLQNESNNSKNINKLLPEYKDGESVRSDIPALFTIGVEYSPIKSLRLSGGFHHYHDKAAKGTSSKVSNNTIEGVFGIEYDAHKIVTISTGIQRTRFGCSNEQINDTNFNLNSWALGFGLLFNCNELINVNVGYLHTFYNQRNVENVYGIPTLNNTYNRSSNLVGASIDFKF